MSTHRDALLLATWPVAARAVDAAWPALAGGGGAVDAVEAACRFAEADATDHTVGVGGLPDRDGDVSLDAAIMASPARRAGVAAVRAFPHRISIARRAMDLTPRTLLAGGSAEAFAEAFAEAQDFARGESLTANARRQSRRWRDERHAAGHAVDAAGAPVPNFEADASFADRPVASAADSNERHDAIGAIALDPRGTLACACSTSGLPRKLPGRVGDSPIVGHDLHCDPGVGACVAPEVGTASSR